MSDFLGRLTARHAESAMPAVTPRAVSRFEASPLPAHHDLVEIGHAAEPRAPTARLPELLATPRERRIAPVAQLIVERSAHAEQPDAKPIEREMPTRMRVEQILKHVETIVTTPVTASHREVVREQQIVATPVIPRIIQSLDASQPSLGRADVNRVAPTENEPTIIRVHIGRIDVRTTAPPPDRTRGRTKPADAAKPMSLDRYLSGKDRP